MDTWATYGFFTLKLVTIVIAILFLWFVWLVLVGVAKRNKRAGYLKITSLNNRYVKHAVIVASQNLPKKAFKAWRKTIKKQVKRRIAQEKSSIATRVFVLKFKGDLHASAVSALREEVNAVLQAANPKHDQVIVLLESPGGVVHGYGLAASQLKRIRDAKIPLTVAVDKVAASGGYMMACVANTIIAAPFAIIGSIGVVYQLPNLYRLLDKHGVEFEQVQAGEFKRTLTMFGKNTAKDRAKVQEDINETHALFKQFVSEQRPVVNIKKVATGEYWYGSQAQKLKLVDTIQTSDDFLLKHFQEGSALYRIQYCVKRSLGSQMRHAAGRLYDVFTAKP